MVAQGLDMPNGIEYYKGSLFIAERYKITRYDNVLETFPQLPKGIVIAKFDEYVLNNYMPAIAITLASTLG